MARKQLIENASATGAGAWHEVPYAETSRLLAQISDTAEVALEYRAREGAPTQELAALTATGDQAVNTLPQGEVRANVTAHTAGTVDAELQHGDDPILEVADFSNPVRGIGPAPPSNLTATDAATPNLDWAPSPDEGGSEVDHYEIERKDTGAYALLDTVRWGVSAYVDDGSGSLSAPAAGTTYTYRVRAVDPKGDESAYSNEAEATTP